MKSQTPRTAKRKMHRPFLYGEVGIPVFLMGEGIPAFLRHLAPDYVQWLGLPPGKRQQDRFASADSFPSKHTGTAAWADLESVPGPAPAACPL